MRVLNSKQKHKTYLLVYSLLVAFTFLWIAYLNRWLCDDALILFRSIEQLNAGHGPVFNIDQRVEVATSMLWYYLLAIPGKFFPVDTVTIVISLLLSALAAVLVLYTAHFRYNKRFLLPFGAILLLIYPFFTEFMTSGLETPLIFFSIATLYMIYCRFLSSERTYKLLFFVSGLLYLVRPELFLAGVIFIALALTREKMRSLKRVMVALSFFFAPLIFSTLFRAAYYGVLVPNPAIAKSFSDQHIWRGISYIAMSFDASRYELAIISILLAYLYLFIKDRRESLLNSPILPFFLSSLLIFLYVIYVGGDYMLGRMLLTPLELLIIPVFFIPLEKNKWIPAIFVSLLVVLPVALTNQLIIRYPDAKIENYGAFHLLSKQKYIDLRSKYMVIDERTFYQAMTCNTHPVKIRDFTEPCGSTDPITPFTEHNSSTAFVYGQYADLHSKAPYRATAVTDYFLGTVSMLVPLEKDVIDRVGIAYPLAAHMKDNRDLLSYIDRHTPFLSRIKGLLVERAGHSKIIPPSALFADRVDLSSSANQIPETLMRNAAETKRYLELCDACRELEDSSTKKLTLGRVSHNILHAYRNTKLSYVIVGDGDTIRKA